MPLSTIERPRMTATPSSAAAAGAAPHYGYAGRGGPGGRGIHTPPQTPPYHGTLNGHHHNAPTLRSGSTLAGPSPYGHLAGAPGGGPGIRTSGHHVASGPATLQHGSRMGPGGNAMLGTLGRQPPQHAASAYGG